MTDWFTPLIGIIGVIIGVGITEFRQWMERKEKYFTMIFEKRLGVHQEAYSLCRQLLQDVRMLFDERLQTGKMKLHGKCIDDASKYKNWWYDNCLYLDEKSQEIIPEMVLLVIDEIGALTIVDKNNLENLVPDESLEIKFKETLDSIAKGIGVKYLPEFEK